MPSTSTSSRSGCRTSKAARPSCGGIFDFDAKKLRLSEVAKLTEDPEIWNDPQRAQELGKERKTLEGVVGTLERLDAGVRDAKELFEIAREEADDATLTSVNDDAAELEQSVAELEFRRMFANPADPNNCFVDIQAGSGGTEEQDWAAMLERMYLRYCERKGFKVEVLEESPGDVAVMKNTTFKVAGTYPHGHR